MQKSTYTGVYTIGICKLPLQIETFIITLYDALFNLPEVTTGEKEEEKNKGRGKLEFLHVNLR